MKFNAFFMFSIICVVALHVEGAPVEKNSYPTPCLDKQIQIELEWDESGGAFPSLYFPRCDEDGITWEPTQCTYRDEKSCFCVHPESGAKIEGTDFRLSERNRSCLYFPPAERTLVIEGACHVALRKFVFFMEDNENVVDSPLGYRPDCADKVYFKALQRNENHFFCVNIFTGEVFDDTRVVDDERPISEEICQDYPDSWYNTTEK